MMHMWGIRLGDINDDLQLDPRKIINTKKKGQRMQVDTTDGKHDEEPIKFHEFPATIRQELVLMGFEGGEPGLVCCQSTKFNFVSLYIEHGLIDAADLKVLSGMPEFRAITGAEGSQALRVTFHTQAFPHVKVGHG